MSKRGRPFQPGNHFGRGRPKGSRNKRSSFAKQLLDSYSQPVIQKSLAMALQGDGQLLRALLGYLLQRPKDPPCKTGPGDEDDQSPDIMITFVDPPPDIEPEK